MRRDDDRLITFIAEHYPLALGQKRTALRLALLYFLLQTHEYLPEDKTKFKRKGFVDSVRQKIWIEISDISLRISRGEYDPDEEQTQRAYLRKLREKHSSIKTVNDCTEYLVSSTPGLHKLTSQQIKVLVSDLKH